MRVGARYPLTAVTQLDSRLQFRAKTHIPGTFGLTGDHSYAQLISLDHSYEKKGGGQDFCSKSKPEKWSDSVLVRKRCWLSGAEYVRTLLVGSDAINQKLALAE